MPTVKINPTDLSAKGSSELLGALLQNAEKGKFFSSRKSYRLTVEGIEYHIKLQYSVYKESDKNSRVLIKAIGSGGQGEVYLAETVVVDKKGKAIHKDDPQHLRLVKVNKPENILVFGGQTLEEAAKAEAVIGVTKGSATASLYNPLRSRYTVVYEDETSGKDYFYASSMHFIKGKTLADVIREQKKLSTGMRFALSRKLMEAIKELHDSGIIHTDIKPQNIIADLDLRTHTVKSLRIIDMDTAEKKKEKKQAWAKTSQYRYPQLEYNVTEASGVDVYGAAISLLQVWAVPGDKVQTPEDYDKKRNFKAQTTIDNKDLSLSLLNSLNELFKNMSCESKNRINIDTALKEISSLEFDYKKQSLQFSEADLVEINSARQAAQSLKVFLKQLAAPLLDPNENEEPLSSIKERFKAVQSLDENPLSLEEFIAAADIQALQTALSFAEIAEFINQQMALFASNAEALQANESPGKESLLKKIKKCRSIDDIVAFNGKYSDRIQDQVLHNSHDKDLLTKEIISRISAASNYYDLQKLFCSIKNNEKFLKTERGLFLGTIGKYGSTKSWVEIMIQIENKALEIADKELRERKPEYEKTLRTAEQKALVCDQFRRRYQSFFDEKTGRILQSGAVEKFNQSLNDCFNAGMHELKTL